MNVKNLLARSTDFYSDQTAIIHRNRNLTYLQAWRRGIQMANALLKLGLKPRDCIGVLEDNCLESSDIYLGLSIANMVRVPLYAGSGYEIHKHMLAQTNCKALIVSSERLKEVQGIKKQLKNLKHLIIRDQSYENWLKSNSITEPFFDISQDDLFIIRHSGGTSGFPKAIGISHKKWLSSMRDWFFPLPSIVNGDTFIHISPLSHASGYMFLPVWAAGGINVMVSSFTPEKCIKIMQKNKAAYIFAAPSQLNALVQSGYSNNPGDFPYLKAIMSGGAPIPTNVIKSVQDIFGDVFYQSFGQTECGIVSIGTPWQWKLKKNETSNPLMACGMPLHFVDIKIIDNDIPVPPGEAGEIVVHTDNMMDHYYDIKQQDKKSANNWIHTGDVGRLDKNGFLYILGRLNDVITSYNKKIYPLELENVICSQTEVLEAGVTGLTDKNTENSILVCCTVKKGSGIKENEIESICRKTIESNEVPIYIRISNHELPKSSVGKLLRSELKNLL